MAEGLVRKRLAACCNVFPGLTSFYRWNGKQESSREVLLLIKTEARCVEAVSQFLQGHHPYDLPELVGVPIQAGDKAYLEWMRREIR
ncbi:MAG: divalent-cation tolerance protein CutA [Candidatus Omnitrophota bacterium]